MPNRKSTN